MRKCGTCSVELGQLRFQLPVEVLRSADETHRSDTESVAVQGAMGGFEQTGVVAQSEVVVGAEIEDGHVGAGEVDDGRLRGADDAFGFESSWREEWRDRENSL